MPNPTDTPVNQVIQMRNQGLSNNQIAQYLQRQGYNSTQIYDAMNQADMKGSIEQSPLKEENEQIENPMPPNLGYGEQEPAYGQEFFQQPSNIATEEIVESIIDEKWEELVKDINKVIEWKNKTESRMTIIEQKMEDIKASFDQLHKAVVGKIGDYDKHILEVGTEIKAMEKVFQKVLPSFTENVNELSRIADKMKKEKSVSKTKK